MKRRTCLKTMLAAGAAGSATQAATGRPIQIHVDLSVDPAKEKEMLKHFHNVFRPTAAKFEGYIDVRMLKLRAAVTGSAPPGINYRFELMYRNEELRQTWVKSPEHQKVWPPIEGMLRNKDYSVVLFDET
ncbi:MAG: hypothetical protein IT159_03460 [Bryobacterales bacterium]|nr:hypothetical protein [Bryobacterales bacterium]